MEEWQLMHGIYEMMDIFRPSNASLNQHHDSITAEQLPF